MNPWAQPPTPSVNVISAPPAPVFTDAEKAIVEKHRQRTDLSFKDEYSRCADLLYISDFIDMNLGRPLLSSDQNQEAVLGRVVAASGKLSAEQQLTQEQACTTTITTTKSMLRSIY